MHSLHRLLAVPGAGTRHHDGRLLQGHPLRNRGRGRRWGHLRRHGHLGHRRGLSQRELILWRQRVHIQMLLEGRLLAKRSIAHFAAVRFDSWLR